MRHTGYLPLPEILETVRKPKNYNSAIFKLRIWGLEVQKYDEYNKNFRLEGGRNK